MPSSIPTVEISSVIIARNVVTLYATPLSSTMVLCISSTTTNWVIPVSSYVSRTAVASAFSCILDLPPARPSNLEFLRLTMTMDFLSLVSSARNAAFIFIL